MRTLAAFAASPSGKTYARVCRYWRRDPGAPLEGVDDVLAENLRLGLAFVLERDDERAEEPVPGPETHPEAVAHLRGLAATHDRSERLRRALGG